MPKYTFVNIDLDDVNVPGTPSDVNFLARCIKAGYFSHRGGEWAKEKDVFLAIKNWEMRRNSPRVVIKYEPASYDEIRIVGFKAAWNNMSYDYPQPFTVPINKGVMVPVKSAIAIAPVSVNDSQSTHTHSVHKTVADSIEKLKARYSRINVDKNIKAVMGFAKEITVQNFPNSTDIERKAAKRFIARMEYIFHVEEKSTNTSLKRILALVWEGMNDNTGASQVNQHDAKECFLRRLYEIQRGDNLDESGRDNGEMDQPICIGGTINKLVDTLNGGFHDDVFIAYITKETAGNKLKALVREHATAYARASSNKNELLNDIAKLKTPGSNDWGIPDSILDKIKEKVKQEFHNEFESTLSSVILNSILEQYEYVSLTESDFKKISQEQTVEVVAQTSSSNVAQETKIESEKLQANMTTPRGNKAWLPVAFGALLVGVGVVLALIPIPIVTQALGGSLIALGAGIAAGLVGGAFFTYGVVKSVAKPQSPDHNQQEATSNDNINHGPQTIIQGLSVTQKILDKASASNKPMLLAESAQESSIVSKNKAITSEEHSLVDSATASLI
ncbi:hypothetical protein [Legionella cardiaca]|uniref:Dot/Icm T4SS effector n=1 Tax=Legionella cardiaca TaxID=1071983 RepID=A0ABY8AN51_9GAMM|nr:hypothetical protein [Legionella cardiaca]WED41953.1 hypothetical protein PXX05_08390 [Legionella cardiaca]